MPVFPVGKLCYACTIHILPQNPVYRLAYRFDIYASEPMSRHYVFVDAVSGEIVDMQDRIQEGIQLQQRSLPMQEHKQLSPTVSIVPTGCVKPVVLPDWEWRHTICNVEPTMPPQLISTDADNTWNNVNANKDQYATDAHLATEKKLTIITIIHMAVTVSTMQDSNCLAISITAQTM